MMGNIENWSILHLRNLDMRLLEKTTGSRKVYLSWGELYF